jgi:hypothetical protein
MLDKHEDEEAETRHRALSPRHAQGDGARPNSFSAPTLSMSGKSAPMPPPNLLYPPFRKKIDSNFNCIRVRSFILSDAPREREIGCAGTVASYRSQLS